ncbi:hypothetical protein ACGF0K_39435 [Streptomyces sp. NPDC048156]|uniref:hypothetical protein n=1 Tax=Streptomyces sp. NPDC048156 TaxID=3365502 RepID=UPI00371D152A
MLYTPDGSLALTDLGLLLRVQRIGEVPLSRPLFVIEERLESEFYRDHLPPIYSHRHLLADPDRTGMPVLSMYQTDINYYGTDLVDYFHHEFGRPVPTPQDHEYAEIPFWSYFLE